MQMPASAEFCQGFESSWATYAAVRSTVGVTPDDEYDAHARLVESWESLLSGGADSNTADIVHIAERNLDLARVENDTLRRSQSATYFWNGMDSIAAICRSAKTPVTWRGRDDDLTRDDVPSKQ